MNKPLHSVVFTLPVVSTFPATPANPQCTFPSEVPKFTYYVAMWARTVRE